MKTLWLRLVLWFGLTFLGISAGFLVLPLVLEQHSHSGGLTVVPRLSPDATNNSRSPETSGNDSHASVRWQAAYALTILAGFVLVALVLSYKISRPAKYIGDQLDLINPHNLGRKIWVDDDTPETKLLVDQINALLARTNVALMSLQQFAAQVSHELRTPLTVMRLKLEKAAEKIEPQLAEEIQAELMRLSLHVERALLIARAERGQIPLDKAQFDLEPLLLDVVSDFRLLAHEESREIEISSSPSFILADASYVRQILNNLLANAIKHGQGRILVRLRTEAEGSSLLIVNAVKSMNEDDFNLGLGKRMVVALANAHGTIQVLFHAGEKYHASNLKFSAIVPSAVPA